jgi:hypothetical protein
MISGSTQAPPADAAAPGRITPIPTWFNGIRHQSRLEARYATAFWVLGIRAEYEPQGWRWRKQGQDQAYLPDFWLTDYWAFVEVKHDPSDRGCQKARELALELQLPVLLLFGGFETLFHGLLQTEDDRSHFGVLGQCSGVSLKDGRRCDGLVIADDEQRGANVTLVGRHHHQATRVVWDGRARFATMRRAVEAARANRFDRQLPLPGCGSH